MWFRVCLGKMLTETQGCKQTQNLGTEMRNAAPCANPHPTRVQLDLLFRVHCKGVNLSLMPYKFGYQLVYANLPLITYALLSYEISQCVVVCEHIPLLFLSIIVFSVCRVFISCGLLFPPHPLFLSILWTSPPPHFF